MEFREEGRYRLLNQDSAFGGHELYRSAVGQLDKAALVDGDNRGRAGFDQDAHPFLRFEAQAAVAQELGGQQTASAQCQSFEAQPNVTVRGIQIAEPLTQQGASQTQDHDAPARQKPGGEHDGEQV